jgi:acyl-CoA reductase-like NAD-dependent aldehyde dehydrogenase
VTVEQETISPVDGSVYVTRPLASGAEIDGVLGAAASAHAGWKATPVAERVAVCRAAAAHLEARADEVGEALTWQMGRPIAYSPKEISGGFRERAAYMLDEAEASLADLDVGDKAGFTRFIRREPLGTVLVLAPWNYPYLCSVNAVLPALAAGNSVVLKVAAQTPLVAEHYADAFVAAGLPDGVFQFVHADHAAVASMVGDARVDFVAFTGSVGGGHAVVEAAANRFVGLGLELGGKDPAYVRADAPIAATAAGLVDGAFFNSGQSCCAVERIYVHRDRYDEFVEAFVAEARGLRLGDPTDPSTTLGPLVRPSAADAVREQLADAELRGARPLLDPSPFAEAARGGAYLAPQVLVDVDHTMALMTEETFGPAIGIMAVGGDDEAVALMNDSRYGLTASVWTADVEAAIAIGDRVDTGTWYLNRCDYLDPALAWTGVKDSGRGCTLSTLGYEALTRPKSFHLRLPQ